MVSNIRKWCLSKNISLRQVFRGESSNLLGKKIKDLLPRNFPIMGWEDDKLYDRFKLLDEWDGDPALVLVIPSYNNLKWVSKNLGSVFAQQYGNYRVIYIDDRSVDGTLDLVNNLVSQSQMWGRVTIYRQPERNQASGSRYSAYHLCDADEIICMLDGDDWLNGKDSLGKVASLYCQGAFSTYGSYMVYGGGNGRLEVLGNEKFPSEVIRRRCFRNYRWTSCHLRTGYAYLFQQINLTDLLDPSFNFLHSCTDLAEMYPILEQSGEKILCCSNPIYIYNKIASLENQTSYFHLSHNPIENGYREFVKKKLSKIQKYPRVGNIEKILQKRLEKYKKDDYRIVGDLPKELIDLLWLTKAKYLVVGIPLERERSICLFEEGIRVGFRINITSLSNKYIERLSDDGLDLIVSVRDTDVKRWI